MLPSDLVNLIMQYHSPYKVNFNKCVREIQLKSLLNYNIKRILEIKFYKSSVSRYFIYYSDPYYTQFDEITLIEIFFDTTIHIHNDEFLDLHSVKIFTAYIPILSAISVDLLYDEVLRVYNAIMIDTSEDETDDDDDDDDVRSTGSAAVEL